MNVRNVALRERTHGSAGRFFSQIPSGVDEARSPEVPGAQKLRGELSCECSPPAFRFFEDLVRWPGHNRLPLRDCPEPASGARAPRTFPSSHSPV